MPRTGLLPGRNWAILQEVPALAISPRCRAGRSPEFTSDDFPLPDVPTTARKRVRASLSVIVSTWLSRPKNRCSSSSRKGRKPGKGFRRTGTVVLGIGSLAPQRLDEWLHLRFGKASQPIHHIGFLQLDQILLVIRCGFGKIRVGSYRT